jgi:metal-responsive CopG/Arc/MetJ family transcriptional regulator
MKYMHTNGMKVAISIPDDVFEKIDKIAKAQKSSRSQVFVTVAREFIQKREARLIIDKLDEVYSLPDTPEETAKRKAMAEYQQKRPVRKKS